jgi:site-specific DNA-methyltransferase (adenine-specific)
VRPYYEEDGITIYHGDCREILPMLDLSECVIVADPPYGIGHPTDYASRGRGSLAGSRDYGKPVWNHPRSNNYPMIAGDAEPFDPAWLLALGRPMILWGANHYASRLPDASGWLVWDKERPDELDQATCELAWTNYVKGVRRFRWLWNGMMRASKEDLVHPTQKPLALMTWCLSLRWTPPGTVIDTHMGSGTTLEAAKLLGRKAVGIELEESYCARAVARLRQSVLPFAQAIAQ